MWQRILISFFGAEGLKTLTDSRESLYIWAALVAALSLVANLQQSFGKFLPYIFGASVILVTASLVAVLKKKPFYPQNCKIFVHSFAFTLICGAAILAGEATENAKITLLSNAPIQISGADFDGGRLRVRFRKIDERPGNLFVVGCQVPLGHDVPIYSNKMPKGPTELAVRYHDDTSIDRILATFVPEGGATLTVVSGWDPIEGRPTSEPTILSGRQTCSDLARS